jgi:hypothetical protein
MQDVGGNAHAVHGELAPLGQSRFRSWAWALHRRGRRSRSSVGGAIARQVRSSARARRPGTATPNAACSGGSNPTHGPDRRGGGATTYARCAAVAAARRTAAAADGRAAGDPHHRPTGVQPCRVSASVQAPSSSQERAAGNACSSVRTRRWAGAAAKRGRESAAASRRRRRQPTGHLRPARVVRQRVPIASSSLSGQLEASAMVVSAACTRYRALPSQRSWMTRRRRRPRERNLPMRKSFLTLAAVAVAAHGRREPPARGAR